MEVNKKDINKIITQDKVLFFDMDGTLVDTDYANYLSFKQAIQTVINSHFIISFNSLERFNRTILQREFPNINDKEFQEITRRKEKFYSENIEQTKLLPYANDILNKFYKINVTVLVTNCRENRAVMTLNHHNLTNKFTYKFFKESMGNNQHINKFENALTILAIDPQTAVVFENEKKEIIKAIKVGIPIDSIITI